MVKSDVIGVLGGMGPLASAEFVKMIYEQSIGDLEQSAPVVIMYSDPTFPDRTDEFLAGSYGPLLERLMKALHILLRSGATKIVVCCVTIHYLFPKIPDDLKQALVSLLVVIFDDLARSPKQHLLLCSNGTRTLKLFESHCQWDSLKEYIVLPDEEDQHRIHHELIYQIKKNPDSHDLVPLLESFLEKYKVDSFIAGCTEMHLLAKHFSGPGEGRKDYCFIDPLAIIARQLSVQFKQSVTVRR
jgi:aspartate racemase